MTTRTIAVVTARPSPPPPPRPPPRLRHVIATGAPTMTPRTIAVVTAGLSQPSSTRLLADRLAQATVEELALRGVTARVRTVELRDLAHDVVNMMLTGFPSASLKE